jgi:archaellum component FlaF (FlaF/FlaG flagellin family)
VINLNLPSLTKLLQSNGDATSSPSNVKLTDVNVLKDLGKDTSGLNKYTVILDGKKVDVYSETKLSPSKTYQAQVDTTKAKLPTLTKLVNTLESKLDTTQLKTTLKLANVEILKDLGKDSSGLNKYSILLDGKKMEAQSHTKLSPTQNYQAQIDTTKEKLPILSKLTKVPLLFKTLQHTKLSFTPESLSSLIEEKSPHESLKTKILEHLPNSHSKEEFHANSSLLLSLSNNTFTIPVEFHKDFALLQFKKRYNKEKKSVQLDFYATLSLLGPVSGVILLEDNLVYVMIHVAYEETQQLLKESAKDFSYPIEIKLHKSIEPLFDTKINSLLDIKI